MLSLYSGQTETRKGDQAHAEPLQKMARWLSTHSLNQFDPPLLGHGVQKAEKEASGEAYEAQIHGYDLMYYHTKLLDTEYKLDEDRIKEYFPLDVVTDGYIPSPASIFSGSSQVHSLIPSRVGSFPWSPLSARMPPPQHVPNLPADLAPPLREGMRW